MILEKRAEVESLHTQCIGAKDRYMSDRELKSSFRRESSLGTPTALEQLSILQQC